MSVYSLTGVHGYSLNDSYATLLGPQTLFNSGASENTDHDSDYPRDEIQDTMWHQSFVLPQSEPVHDKNVGSVTSPSEDQLVERESDSGYEPEEIPGVSPSPFAQKYQPVGSGYQHPFGLLMKEQMQKTSVEGIGFTTVKDFKLFIESMKSSFLTPGSDFRHFQTAKQTMENEVASDAHNNDGVPSPDYRSDYVEESSQDNATENEVWREPTNSVFEQGQQGTNYHMPSASLSAPDTVISYINPNSPSVYDNQDPGLGSAAYLSPQFVGTEHVASNYGRFSNAGISGETPEPVTGPPDVQNDVQSGNYKLPDQNQFFSSSFGEDDSFRSHVAASALNPRISASQDLLHDMYKRSSINSLTSEQKTQKPKYTYHPKDSPSLNSYGKSIYVHAPRGQYPWFNVQDQLPKQGGGVATSVQPIGKESKDLNLTPTVHLPVSSDSVSSSSNTLSSQSHSAHVGVKESSPHGLQNQKLSKKKPIKSHLLFNVKPSDSPYYASRHLGDLSVSRNVQANDVERSNLSNQIPASNIQQPKQMSDNIPNLVSSNLDSTQRAISSQVSDDYMSFNSLTNLSPTSESKNVFTRFVDDAVMPRNVETQNIISDRFPTGIYVKHRTKKPSGLFSAPQRRGVSLNGHHRSASTDGRLQTFTQPTKEGKRPANGNKKSSIMALRPPKQSTDKSSDSTLNGVFRKNDRDRKRLPLYTGANMSPPLVKTYVVKSRNGYVRARVSLSKTRYTPNLLTEGKTSLDQWIPKYLTASHN